MDMHEILKQALKELEPTASAEDVAAYIAACVAKQDAIDGAAAAEEKEAEKAREEAEELAAPDAPLPVEDKPIEEPPPAPAMSQVAPAAVVATESVTEGANGPGADLDAGAADAGEAQLAAKLAEFGTDIAGLLAAMTASPDAFRALLAPSGPGGTEVSEGQAEGTAPLFDSVPEAFMSRLAAAEEVIKTLSAKLAAEVEVKAQTEAEIKAAEEAAAKAATEAKRTALTSRVTDLVRCARLVPTGSTEATIANWVELGMTQPEKFEDYISTLPAGVPTEAITANAAASTASPGKDTRHSDDAEADDSPAFVNAFRQYREIVGEAEARKLARDTVRRVRGLGTSTTDKLTGAA